MLFCAHQETGLVPAAYSCCTSSASAAWVCAGEDAEASSAAFPVGTIGCAGRVALVCCHHEDSCSLSISYHLSITSIVSVIKTAMQGTVAVSGRYVRGVVSHFFYLLLYLSNLNVIYCDTGAVSSRRRSVLVCVMQL